MSAGIQGRDAVQHMEGARVFPASANRDLTGEFGVLKVYNEAELGVQRLRIPGELKDGGEAIHCMLYTDRYKMPCLYVARNVSGPSHTRTS